MFSTAFSGMTHAERTTIDNLDRKILTLLTEDSRASYREIAKRCSVSAVTVLSRVKKMEQSGIIKGYTTVLDHQKLGYQLTAVTEITVSKGKLLEMEQAISKYPESSKIPAALFKQALSFLELGDKKNARNLFRKVIEQYPRSDQGELAKKKLETIK